MSALFLLIFLRNPCVSSTFHVIFDELNLIGLGASREQLLRMFFLKGLWPDISFHVTATLPGATYNEAYRLATNYESGKKIFQHA